MATRLYLPLTQAAYVAPPAPPAAWEHAAAVLTRALLRAADASTLTTEANNPDAADDLTNKDSLHRQYVSPQLAAQTISGTITAQVQCSETIGNDNLFLTIGARVISQDGTTERAVLFAPTRATSLEMQSGVTYTNRTFPATTISNYTCAAGDRILLEIGAGGNITSGTGGIIGHNASFRWGCNASSGDLGVDETQTGATFRGWAEFSSTINFLDQTVTPGVLAHSLTSFAPTVTTGAGTTAIPGTLALLLTGLAPTVTASDHKVVVPGVLSLVSSLFAPTVTASDHKVVTPGVLSLVSSAFAPTVTVAAGGTVVTPGTLAQLISVFAPTVGVSNNIQVVPSTLALGTSVFAPVVGLSNNQRVIPGTAALTLGGFAPTISLPVVATPSTRSLVLHPYAPTLGEVTQKKTVLFFFGGAGGLGGW